MLSRFIGEELRGVILLATRANRMGGDRRSGYHRQVRYPAGSGQQLPTQRGLRQRIKPCQSMGPAWSYPPVRSLTCVPSGRITEMA
jgi:hypothetical protein